ncbi:small acid-soluble spore protein Tlp [Gracilibacillus alcaliphilus]|uniref:small acid-soluble spore protein Tlp n=1 Tax=Gracilibacillus alcaliphilus TaxID=1401441 RepID=UPI00195BF9D8|nr:small acid-soluble spore protein Tlp [Gracilibacillus alcaliphilus]MBM7676037.1 small acid-soluble spore protein (thioredoxin-like protein) [Gracilibacillus alcaliphilus]
MTKPKPDDRSDNAEKIQNTIGHTLQNMNEAEDFVKAHADEMSSEDKQAIEAKNKRRQESIEGLRAEIKDEAGQE